MSAGRPKRLQGTDGVRGITASAGDPRVAGLSPVESFLKFGLITPEFVELYCYAFVRELLEAGLAAAGGKVVVGYDSRDRERVLVRAALAGVAKAGAVPVDVGVLPTPAVGIHMVSSGAAGALVVTASHNPPDQNGIKLFLPDTGLKLFPADDERLTNRVYNLEGGNLAALAPMQRPVDRAGAAREAFKSFFESSFNSWVAAGDFSDTLLVADLANGALVGLAKEILERFGFRYIEEVGAAKDGSVNVNCGAALLEGCREIGSDFVSPEGRDFRNVELTQAMFHHGRSNREEIGAGRLRVSGAAFDADGDRFYRLEYDPYLDTVLVLSGDESAYHQARFIRRMLGMDYNGAATFASTVESDLNLSAAVEELGFIPVQTGVGDKWLLWEAACQQIGAWWEIISDQNTDFELAVRLEEMEEKLHAAERADAAGMIALCRETERIAVDLKLDLIKAARLPEMLNFVLGGEETGHTVTAGLVTGPKGKQRVVFFGNGLKSAVNTFAATRELGKEIKGREYYRRLHHPFPPGMKRSMQVYYTDKSRLRPGSGAWEALLEAVKDGCRRFLGEVLVPELIQKAEEPGMIYISLEEPRGVAGEGAARAAVFIRNSGTEDKTSIYLRGDTSFEQGLAALAEELVVHVSASMKRLGSPYADSELAVMRRLEENGPAAFSELADLVHQVNPERLIMEMTLKEGFLEVQGDKLALSVLGLGVLKVLDER
jgi:phosphoglucosamine mutase